MRKQKTYLIRQAVLRACQTCHPMPLTAEELSGHYCLAFVPNVSRDELLAEWDGLTANGFLTVCPGSDGEYRALSAKGLNQIKGDALKDQYVFGAMAMRAEGFNA